MGNKDKINSAIRFLKVQQPPIAEVQYIHTLKDSPDVSNGDLLLYDYMSNSHLSLNQLFASAKESGWVYNKNIQEVSDAFTDAEYSLKAIKIQREIKKLMEELKLLGYKYDENEEIYSIRRIDVRK